MKKAVRKASLSERVIALIESARQKVAYTANLAQVYTNYEIGRQIVEEEQGGKRRAGYGEKIIEELSAKLTARYCKGWGARSLRNIRKFYVEYSTDEIRKELIAESEKPVLDISDGKNRMEKDLATTSCQIRTPTGLPLSPNFLGLPERPDYSESELEKRIIDHIQEFMLELGNGFFFGGRQVRLSFGDKHFYADLVFYNRLLRCFFVIDLKIGAVSHKDLGQMQTYVHYYDRMVKQPDENPTIGILLCSDDNKALVEMTLPEAEQRQIFARRYSAIIPSKDKLASIIREEKRKYEKEQKLLALAAAKSKGSRK